MLPVAVATSHVSRHHIIFTLPRLGAVDLDGTWRLPRDFGELLGKQENQCRRLALRIRLVDAADQKAGGVAGLCFSRRSSRSLG